MQLIEVQCLLVFLIFVSCLSYETSLTKEVTFILARCRPWSDYRRRSSTPTDRRIFHDVNATEDWDGNRIFFTSFYFV